MWAASALSSSCSNEYWPFAVAAVLAFSCLNSPDSGVVRPPSGPVFGDRRGAGERQCRPSPRRRRRHRRRSPADVATGRRRLLGRRMDGEGHHAGDRGRPDEQRGNGEHQAWATSRDPALTVAPPAAPVDPGPGKYTDLCMSDVPGAAATLAAAAASPSCALPDRSYIHGVNAGEDGPALRGRRPRRHPPRARDGAGHESRAPGRAWHATSSRLAERSDRSWLRRRGAHRLRPASTRNSSRSRASGSERAAPVSGEASRAGRLVRSRASASVGLSVAALLKREGETIQEWLTLFR